MRIRFRHTGGVWVKTRTWSFGYWFPWSYQPLGVRTGDRGARGWWGAAHCDRRIR